MQSVFNTCITNHNYDQRKLKSLKRLNKLHPFSFVNFRNHLSRTDIWKATNSSNYAYTLLFTKLYVDIHTYVHIKTHFKWCEGHCILNLGNYQYWQSYTNGMLKASYVCCDYNGSYKHILQRKVLSGVNKHLQYGLHQKYSL